VLDEDHRLAVGNAPARDHRRPLLGDRIDVLLALGRAAARPPTPFVEAVAACPDDGSLLIYQQLRTA
jgi:hypothetical protein